MSKQAMWSSKGVEPARAARMGGWLRVCCAAFTAAVLAVACGGDDSDDADSSESSQPSAGSNAGGSGGGSGASGSGAVGGAGSGSAEAGTGTGEAGSAASGGGVGGGVAGSGGAAEAGSGATAGSTAVVGGSTFTDVLAIIDNAEHNCRLCHGLVPSDASNGNLNFGGLTNDEMYQRLVGSSSSSTQCGGRVYVVPGNPDGSLLYDKLANARPACGSRMPSGGFAYLSDEELGVVRAWIEAGALNN